MDKNVTKQGLLALKDSKPVPITAHSHEIIVPCVYTEVVKKMMKEKGIVLPLTPAKLAELRKIAKVTPGQYKPDPDDKAGGTSHAKGTTNVNETTNVKGNTNVKGVNNVMVNIKNIVGQRQGVRRRRGKGGKGGRANVVTTRAAGLVPPPPPMRGPPMINPPAYNMVRPFAANTPVGFEPKPMLTMDQVKQEIHKEEALAKRLEGYDALAKRVEQLDREREKHVRDQMVDDDNWVSPSRDEVIHEKLVPKPKSEVEIEDISESVEPVRQPDEPNVVMPTFSIFELDKGDMIRQILNKGDRSDQSTYLKGIDNKHLQTISKKMGIKLRRPISKESMVRQIIEYINDEEDED